MLHNGTFINKNFSKFNKLNNTKMTSAFSRSLRFKKKWLKLKVQQLTYFIISSVQIACLALSMRYGIGFLSNDRDTLPSQPDRPPISEQYNHDNEDPFFGRSLPEWKISHEPFISDSPSVRLLMNPVAERGSYIKKDPQPFISSPLFQESVNDLRGGADGWDWNWKNYAWFIIYLMWLKQGQAFTPLSMPKIDPPHLAPFLGSQQPGNHFGSNSGV